MKRMMKVMLAMMFAATIASSAAALDTIYFTASPTDGTLGSQTFSFSPSLTNQVLYIWSTNGTSVSPATASTATAWPTDKPPTTAYFSYDLGLSGTTNVALSSAAIDNFNILDNTGNPFSRDTDWNGANAAATVTRWNSQSSFTVGLNSQATASAITQLNAVSLPVPTTQTGTPSAVDTTIHTGLTGTGLTPNSGFVGAQPGYDAAHNAYLIGEVHFNTTATSGTGTTLQVKSSTLNTSASSAIGTSNATGATPNFTATYTDLSTNFNQAAGVFATATINVSNPTRQGDLVGSSAVFPNTTPPDGAINAFDIDRLASDIRNNTTTVATEDYRGATVGSPPDGVVNQNDLDRLVGSLVDINNGGIGGQHGTHYGDANLDRIVDGSDFGILAANFGQNFGANHSHWANADFNGDGIIDGSDFGILAANFGATGGTGALSVVPEPTSMVLLALGGVAVLGLRRKNR